MTAPALSERAWQEVVLELARLYRWRAHHCRPAQRVSGRWSTPIQGDPGFPDLVLARGGRVLFVELKSNNNRSGLDPEQVRWRDVLLGGDAEWFCWRPRHLGEVKEVLAPRARIDWRTTNDVSSGEQL